MSEDQAIGRGEILALMTEIVSAHLANNAVGQSEVPDLIQSVYNKLNELATGEEPASVELTPAVPIKKSVTDDYIICLEDEDQRGTVRRQRGGQSSRELVAGAGHRGIVARDWAAELVERVEALER